MLLLLRAWGGFWRLYWIVLKPIWKAPVWFGVFGWDDDWLRWGKSLGIEYAAIQTARWWWLIDADMRFVKADAQRSSSGALRGFMRKIPCNEGLGITLPVADDKTIRIIYR